MRERRLLTTKAVVKEDAPKIATLVSVKQDAGTKLTATLAAPIEKVDLSDLQITRDDDHAVIAVKSVTLDDTDKTKLSIETYVSMTDGKSYTVTYTAKDDAKTTSTATFTATDGKIASFALTKNTVVVNKATALKYKALDANGVEIYEKAINDKGTNVEIDVTTTNGYVDADKLTLYDIGATATVAVSYHTYKYDANGNEEGKIANTFTVTAVANDATVSKFNYTIVKGDVTPAWENLTAVTRVAMKDLDRYAKFQIKDSSDADITATCGYTVESSDSNIVIATGDVENGALLTPVKEGSAYLILKDKDGKTVTTLPITVVAARFLATFTLDKSSVTIATTAALADPGSESVGYSAKDQYGDAIVISTPLPTIQSQSSDPANLSLAATNDDTNAAGKMTVAATAAVEAKTYGYKVSATAGDITKTCSFTVIVKAPTTGTNSPVVRFMNGSGKYDGASALASLNTTVTNKTSAASTISVALASKSPNGVIVGAHNLSSAVTVAGIRVVGSNGKVYAATGSGVTKPVTSAAITNPETAVGGSDANGVVIDIKVVEKNDTTYTKNLPAGTYTVTLTMNDKKTVSGTFKVEDKQPTLTASVLKTDAGNQSDLKTALAEPTMVKYVYDGAVQVNADGTSKVTVSHVYGTAKDKTAVVKEATIVVPVGGNNKVEITVPINRVFTNAYGWDANSIEPSK